MNVFSQLSQDLGGFRIVNPEVAILNVMKSGSGCTGFVDLTRQ